MASDERVQKLRNNLQKKSVPFYNVFNTMEGQEVLAQLAAEFAPTIIVHDSPHQTIVKAAQRDVIEYIKSMIRLREDDLT
jgi:hypothetical protein